MRVIVLIFGMLLPASGFVTLTPSPADAQSSIQRRAERPLVPRSQSRRQADRAAPRVYVPGHWAWNARRGQYSWVAGRWERYDRNHAFVGAGLGWRDGQWSFGPTR
ncbi:MAG: hypothetical protein AB7V13_17665 [Pseudorhodoplanes sp.]|uniref:hypothetical protein n=1 Tax=Pseudorhodoplanes sp. TaxID=1934341 RepID=UPI003D0D8034